MQDRISPISFPQEGDKKPAAPRFSDLLSYLQNNAAATSLGTVLTIAKTHQQKTTAGFFEKKDDVKSAGLPSVALTPQKAVEGSVQNELDALLQLIQYLQKYFPNDPNLAKYIDMLNQVSKDFPNLDSGDLNKITQIFQGLLKMAASLPDDQQLAFLKKMKKVLKDLQDANGALIDQLNATKAQIQAKLDFLSTIIADMNYVKQILQDLAQGQTLTPDQLNKLMASLVDLLMKGKQLSPEEQKAVGTLFEQLGKMQTAQVSDILSVLSASLTYYLLWEYSQNNVNATVSGMKDWIKKQLSEWGGDNFQSDFLKKIFDQMGGIISTSDFPQGTTPFGWPYAYVNGDNYSANGQFWQGMSAVWFFTSDSVNDALTGIGDVINYFNTDYQSNVDQMEGISISVGDLTNLGNNIKTARDAVDSEIFIRESLPDAFADAILNHFMPNQEAYLRQLAQLLFYMNFGANMDNIILDKIKTWQSADDNYNFNDWYKANSNTADQSTVESHITDEDTSAKNNIADAQKAQDAIKKKLAEIDADEKSGKLTPDQAKTLRDQLNKENDSITQVIANLTQLRNDLATAMAQEQANGKIDDNTMKAIQADESLVTKGDPNNNGFGGLMTIYNDITSQQTEWSSQSQDQQIRLQEQMTITQQEWTIVSTSLQALNQVYMTLAQGIYK